MKLETVIEMPDFQRRAKAAMTEAERLALIDFLAANPLAGVLLGGGLRKVRFARTGGGKSGGFRTIHYYKPEVGPVFLVTMFAKNEKSNLSAKEMEYLIQLGEILAAECGERQ
ncbi:hypothetical protein GCM10010873_29530 [Cypionkella aquatica]|uniref:Addiction module toxin RelE n=1 Tax=Cypionkella aquatica TaxID=1756042 RepID=A0AA37X2C8_9RHOB|nr:type II toxin-antitoxin system RelE/ParE family toxin [Cypionkella aquatica]GLS87979.1 hypothetical protein GCM10010873_29530 [Cypionkella aquatica]